MSCVGREGGPERLEAFLDNRRHCPRELTPRFIRLNLIPLKQAAR
jgi:hypothetical protein